MADSGRWGRMLSRWGVRVMDGVVSAVARRPVRTGAVEAVVTATGTLAAGGDTKEPEGPRADARESAGPRAGARKSAESPAGAMESAGPRAGAMKSAGPRAGAMESAGPRAGAMESAESSADAMKSAESSAGAMKSAGPPPAPTKSAAPSRARKLVTVARDPDTAFVYWACPEDEGEARLVWRAGARTVRVERVAAASGKRYLPFVAPDEPHTATLELGGDELHSNAARPPEAAPRAAGPAVFIHPSDPARRALAERQRRQREQLARPTHPRPEHLSSSRSG